MYRIPQNPFSDCLSTSIDNKRVELMYILKGAGALHFYTNWWAEECGDVSRMRTQELQVHIVLFGTCSSLD